jgi:truncated hemoglobin YjbI
MTHTPAYETLGGEQTLRNIIHDFVNKMASDVMIGFFFTSVNLTRLKELEFQHASAFLGGPHTYKGRPLTQAHAPHPIMGGHFARRLVLLRETLQEHAVPVSIIEAWLAHNQSLQSEITSYSKHACS